MKPVIDMTHRGDKFLVSVELPGVRQEDISLETSGRHLVVKAKYRDGGSRPGDQVYLAERKRKDLCRYIYMPFTADLAKLEMARYKDGVLHVQVPEISLGRHCRSIPVRSD